MSLLATPFHARAAQANRHNAWQTRGGFTLATCYSDTEEEALAARFGAIIADVSWHWHVELTGAQAAEFVSRLFTRDVTALKPGYATEALWLNDKGAVRGAGTVARLADESFLLIAAMEDAEWITSAARLYGVSVHDHRQGVLAVIGPAGFRLLRAAGLDASLAPMTFGSVGWRGVEVTLSRFGLGFELWCDPDSALIVWDRLRAVGRRYALRPAGQAALDILEFESGVMRPGREYQPARDGFAAQPTPQSLGLNALVERRHVFNGRAGVLGAGPDTSLAGVLLDSETAAGTVALTHQGREIGRTLAARYSPAMRCAMAFAILDGPWPATAVMAGATPCRPAALPFLPVPVPMDATEIPPGGV